MNQDLLGDLKLCRDVDNTTSGDRVIVPSKRSLKESVELWKGQKSSLLMRRNTIMGARSGTSSCDGDGAQTSLQSYSVFVYYESMMSYWSMSFE
jgi:hypothetical protein